ncbi:hypothetical protein FHY52_04535 [Nocardia nova]|uniref:hypothetical protein n=1 Tax=Nocardia nova TaxID=37330 RepID=UPI0025AF1D9D|nr:hypothetical protein [Nocardia nova]MDN2495966.1 hypothetical protein [Nocardia nova]
MTPEQLPSSVDLLSRTVGHPFLDAQLATVNLTMRQALTLCDVISVPLADLDHQWLHTPGTAMATVLRTAAREPHHNERWGVTFTDLADTCETWSPAQAFAVLDAITRSRALQAGWTDAIHMVGLWHRQPVTEQHA